MQHQAVIGIGDDPGVRRDLGDGLVYPMQGSIDGTSGDHILLAPPAVITDDQVSWSVDELAGAIREAQS